MLPFCSRWRMLLGVEVTTMNECDECNGAGFFAPVYHGEREAPDGRERRRCDKCDGAGRVDEECEQ